MSIVLDVCVGGRMPQSVRLVMAFVVASGARGLIALLAAAAAFGAASAQPPERDFATYRPTVEPVRIARDEAPQIDGDLSDPAWSKAAVIDEFYQLDPVAGAQPSERTVAYLMYDERTMYVAVHAYDSEPDQIVALANERDGSILNDDAVFVLFDSYATERDSFFFGVNSLGAREDLLVENNDEFFTAWDVIWRAKARRVDDGYVVEMAIPFQSFSFDASLPYWGLQVERRIPRRNEIIRWSVIDQSRPGLSMSRAGRMAQVQGVDSGVGLDVQTFAGIKWERDWEAEPRDDDVTFEPSMNAYYKVTPSLTGLLTVNTDFSDAPLDERQINTSRFGLFFPEVRDFFLQDSPIFQFGGQPFTVRNSAANGRPFFSRRIGVVDGEPVDLNVGLKLSGSHGRFGVGALTARTGSRGELDSQQLSVVRLTSDVLEESRVGMVFTHGDPSGETRNSVAGLDFQYLNSNLPGVGRFVADAYYLRSFSDEETSEGDAFGAVLARPNDRLNISTRWQQFGENYDPRLGFVNRTGVRRYDGSITRRFRPRDSWLRTVDLQFRYNIYTDLDGELETRALIPNFEIETNAGDEFQLQTINLYELVRAPFTVAGAVTIPAGEYDFQRNQVEIRTNPSRVFSMDFELGPGTWFHGEKFDIELTARARLSRYFRLEWAHVLEMINTPTGDFDINIDSVDAIVNFTPDMQLSTQIQYDNVTEDLGYLGRFSWELRPGTDVLLAVSNNAITDFDEFRAKRTEVIFRVGNTFRF